MNAPIPRRANGTVMPGYTANPGGRPKTAIETARAQLLPRLSLYLERLDDLTLSDNENVRLGAIKEILDRLLGKAAVFVDTTNTRLDIGQLYLDALRRANSEGKTVNGSSGDEPS